MNLSSLRPFNEGWAKRYGTLDNQDTLKRGGVIRKVDRKAWHDKYVRE